MMLPHHGTAREVKRLARAWFDAGLVYEREREAPPEAQQAALAAVVEAERALNRYLGLGEGQ